MVHFGEYYFWGRCPQPYFCCGLMHLLLRCEIFFILFRARDPWFKFEYLLLAQFQVMTDFFAYGYDNYSILCTDMYMILLQLITTYLSSGFRHFYFPFALYLFFSFLEPLLLKNYDRTLTPNPLQLRLLYSGTNKTKHSIAFRRLLLNSLRTLQL